METTVHESLDAAGGRFIARLYGFAGAAVVAWTALEAQWGDARLIWFVAVCAAGSAVPSRLPWDNHSGFLLRLMVGGAAAVQAAFVPLWMDHPGMLIFPALGTAYAGSVLSHRWVFGQLAPVTLTFFALSIGEDGIRSAMASTSMYGGLWATIGLVPLWMRGQLDDVLASLDEARALDAERAAIEAERHAAENVDVQAKLAHRQQLAATLREEVSHIVDEASGIEQQSSGIASAVDQLANSLRDVADTATETERSLQIIASSSSESQQSVSHLASAGNDIVGIVDTIAELAEQTNLLALNATIEAARAGSAGSGFAVVANEVKELARRTAESAAGIGEVVEQIQSGLRTSSDVIEHAANQVVALETEQHRLTEAVKTQSEIVSGIAEAASLGVTAADRIGNSVKDLEKQAINLANG